MPYSPAEKKKAITRLKRIGGQTEALQRAVECGESCGAILQQLAALRGAVNGLMAEILEGHMKESFLLDDAGVDQEQIQRSVQETIALVRSYLK